MSAKLVHYDMEARDALKQGVDKLANAVKVTLGPRGRNVVIEKSFGAPTVTKDGVTVANSVILLDPVENMGATLLKEAARQTVKEAGDGTTTATVLAHSVLKQAFEFDDYGSREIRDGISKIY